MATTHRGPSKSASQGGSGRHRGQAAAETKGAVSKGTASKVAAEEAAGGGPEDPLADIAAAGTLLKGQKKQSKKDSGPSATEKLVGGNKGLLAEFIICFVILGLGTIVKPSSTNNGIPRLMLKSSALAGLFLILALVSSTGGKARKAATGLGALVTVTYIVASSDAIAIFNWANSYFGNAATKAGEGVGNLGSAVSSGTESVTTEGNTSTPAAGIGGTSGASE